MSLLNIYDDFLISIARDSETKKVVSVAVINPSNNDLLFKADNMHDVVVFMGEEILERDKRN